MAHYENTQGIEWKVNIGVWTLLAATAGWASKNVAATTSIPTWGWSVALLLIVVAHWLWLWLMHRSEEEDKRLWCEFRNKALTLLGASSPTWPERDWWKELFWLVSECGVTVGLAFVLWLVFL